MQRGPRRRLERRQEHLNDPRLQPVPLERPALRASAIFPGTERTGGRDEDAAIAANGADKSRGVAPRQLARLSQASVTLHRRPKQIPQKSFHRALL